MRLAELEAIYMKWYQIDDIEPVHVALGAVAANQLDGDPLWQFLVAAPGSLKTEIIRSLSGIECVYPLSNLTAQTFASGYQTKGEEPSLLMKLDGKILTLKDFTTILTMHRDKRGEILAQLREIYDGHYRKEFGNAKVVDWTGKLGLIAGVTPIIDTHYSVSQILGERFLLYRFRAPDEITVARRSMRQQGCEDVMRTEVRQAVAAFVGELAALPVPIPEQLEDRIASLAAFTARARSGVVWDGRGDIEYVPEPEGPGRLAKQFATLARGLAVVRGTRVVTPADYLTVHHVAQDTVPGHRRALIDQLVKRYAGPAPTTADLAQAIGYPTNTARRYLLELAAMRLADRDSQGAGHPDRWCLSERAANLIDAAHPLDATRTSNVVGGVVSE